MTFHPMTTWFNYLQDRDLSFDAIGGKPADFESELANADVAVVNTGLHAHGESGAATENGVRDDGLQSLVGHESFGLSPLHSTSKLRQESTTRLYLMIWAARP